ncbi:gliding motility lipoprotein GldB, partial [Xanthovirga aplysinae]|uniref:gliding motility lipoprotein GldB n=1 Tax=Xanthovirga aplysinae TaxID=2529853 RepID=UPI001656E84E
SGIQFDLSIERLENELFHLQTKAEIKSFLEEHPLFSRHFLNIDRYPDQSMVVDQLYGLVNDSHIDTLYQQTEQTFRDFSGIKSEMEGALKLSRYYIPDFVLPKINTFVTGLSNDLHVSDSLIVIGLDFFIGDSAKYLPDVPKYIQRRYQKEYIVPTVVLLMSDRYNKTSFEDQTMLAEMIYYGKAYYYSKKMLPCVPDSVLIGYSSEEFRDVNANQETVWAHFLQNELLYSTQPGKKAKYLSERPKVYEIGNKCPGRVGVWLGWEIVKKYMEEHPEVTLEQLMKDSDAKKIFIESKYKAKNKNG